ncbi:dihydrolipoamide acetyltransferase family protein [Parabacteroides distasonis]|uniref:dihydrolipoamide acetyltransferase family protein n=1 Tax=Parabacteroides distasonis TaxID=823 RepID=UPI00189FAF7C|nr:dihydrolipoamide acetyltransferase family protein [Parabacteroides distasonis]MDB9151296.1 dihydrolipoamide acetyltransferase family protein [Parabacteroides distasonis]MDB9155966.1 dihydrolipoamide acetyltransferase family protein [Parabacteroides distasonis]MDB9164985.1 dihydrolipoamide acetyltransferase family protein [Parabacteroides distasonis]MDB9169516.1 dihydrolipoamide acetyltransferase family protein [Parabacteroides distasonis]MDB9193448.1 dihydrolipoamide acetyltransferase famil
MATFEIKMPKLGESITEGTIISWSVKVGDTVEEDDVLFEVSTAKVSAEIPSPVEGKVKQLLFNEGDTVAVGTVVAILEIEGEGEDNGAQPETSEATQPKEQVPVPASEELSKNSQEEDRWYSPVVLQLAKAAGVSQDELDHIPGTGYLGRLSKKDIQTYIDHKNKGTEMPKPKQAPVSSMQQTATSTPTITVAPPTAPSMPMTAATPSAPLAQGDEVREMDRVRKIIADHMVLSKKVSPHVTSVIEVDVTRLVNWRKKVKDQFFKQEGINLTYMPAITEATAKALKAYPLVNSSVDGYNIILKKPINIGIAVSLNDGNLIVPVIHDADKLNLSGLASQIDTLAAKARENKLAPDSIQGGTFTITNFGTFKSLFGTPIINQPQVAILAVGYIEKKPAVVETPEGDTIAIRHKMYLSLSYDHRIVDGALAGAFLRSIADELENWNA